MAHILGVGIMGVSDDDGISINDAGIAQDLAVHGVPLQVLEPAAGHQPLPCRPVLQPPLQVTQVDLKFQQMWVAVGQPIACRMGGNNNM